MAATEWASYTVYTKDAWGDAWAANPNLICTQLQINLMPSVDSARLFWRAGEIIQPADAGYSTYAPLDLLNKWVRVVIGSLGIDWVGYVVQRSDARTATDDEGLTIKVLDSGFVAVGLEWFFTRTQLRHAMHFKEPNNTKRSERAIGFNMGMGGEGRSLSEEDRANRSKSDADGIPVFASKREDARIWNAWEIVTYLLEHHGPQDASGDPAPVPIELAGSARPFLEWYEPSVPTEGRTLLQVLEEVIDRRRGLIWWLTGWDTGTATLNVSSTLTSAIAFNNGTSIPAAISQQVFDFDSRSDIESASINRDASQQYHRVRVRAAQRRTVMTVSIADGNLETSWSPMEKTAYDTGLGDDADKNDRFRTAQRFQRVYTTFRIPEDWNGKVGSGDGSTANEEASPKLAPGSQSVIGTEPFSLPGLRLLRTTPLKAGFDYNDAVAPVGNLPAGTGPEYLEPFAIIKHGAKWVFVDRAAQHRDEDAEDSDPLKYSYSMRPLASEPGFQLDPNGGLPHVLASGDWPEEAGASNFEPEVAYSDMRMTVCCEFDSYCEGFHPAADPTGAPVQELVIYISDRYRLDWLCAGTILDIGDDGLPKLCQFGGPIQDDRGVCENLARLAYEHYRQPRATLAIEFAVADYPVPLGTLITTIGETGTATEETVESVVSQVVFQPEAGRSSMQTAFAELDFGGLV